MLGIGMAGEAPGDKASIDQAAGELLRARLAGTLPLKTAVVDALPAILGKLGKDLLPLSGKSLGEVLLDESTDLKAVKAIKDYGKRLAARKDTEADHAAAIAIYYAAIASALLFHDERITSHGYEYLRASFEELAEEAWIPAGLTRHFSKARKMCEKKRE